jgi:hypothetical protein
MSGVFDRLKKRMDIESQEGGISPLDLANLPPLLRKIMRHMLREHELMHREVLEWAEELPEADRPDQKELDQALEALSRQFWLIKRGEGERVRYQANLRRKAASKIAQGVWSVLDDRIASLEEKKDPPQEE